MITSAALAALYYSITVTALALVSGTPRFAQAVGGEPRDAPPACR